MTGFFLVFFAGYNACYVMDYFGFYYHQKGVDYYGEVHTTTQNVIAHVVGMPFTIYGILLWFPALLMCSAENAWQVQIGLFILYLGHYLRIEQDSVVVFVMMYWPGLILSLTTYTPGFYGFFYGITISTIALVFQEYVGHYLGGDPPSRKEGVPNAIFYAMYFSAHSLKKFLSGEGFV